MAKIVLITGPQAVGKMTVGQELSKITDLKLFHNHMTMIQYHIFSVMEQKWGKGQFLI